MSNCNFTFSTPAIQTLHVLPRLTPPSFLYDLHNFNTTLANQFNLFDQNYWIVTITSTVIYTASLFLLFTFVLSIFGCATICCSKKKTRQKRPCSFCLLLILHVLVLLCVAVTTFLPVLGSAAFGDGIQQVLHSYEIANTNFSNVDIALTSLNINIQEGDNEIKDMIRKNPCGGHSTSLLHNIDASLSESLDKVNGIVQVLGPLNETLTQAHGEIHQYVQQGEHIRWYAILLPMGCTLLYVVLELIASCNPMKCCEPICCFAHVLARLVGYITLFGLLCSTCVYLTLGTAAADYCTAPDASILRTAHQFQNQDVAQYLQFYTQCSSSFNGDVALFESYFDKIDENFDSLTSAMAAWKMSGCPMTKNADRFVNNCKAAQEIFDGKISEFRYCTTIQPQYCTFVEEGMCGSFIKGTFWVAVCQTAAACVLFFSLFCSFWFANLSGWENKTKRNQHQKENREQERDRDRNREYDSNQRYEGEGKGASVQYNRMEDSSSSDSLNEPLLDVLVVPVNVNKSRFKSVYDVIGADEEMKN